MLAHFFVHKSLKFLLISVSLVALSPASSPIDPESDVHQPSILSLGMFVYHACTLQCVVPIQAYAVSYFPITAIVIAQRMPFATLSCLSLSYHCYCNCRMDALCCPKLCCIALWLLQALHTAMIHLSIALSSTLL